VLINLDDFEREARARLPQMAYDYYASGAGDEVTLRENRAAWQRRTLSYRVLVDVSRRDLSTQVLGQPVSLPILIAPTALQRLAHPDGEQATARAAGRAGTVMILSTLSTTAVEDVVAQASGPVWFQLYIYKDRGVTRALVERVRRAGCGALVLTVDAPLLGRRERDVRNGLALPPGLSLCNLAADGMDQLPPSDDSRLGAYVEQMHDANLSWKDVEWLRQITDVPVLVKGIVRADDAARAVDHGAAGVVVSNHGGRQLDGAPATADVLPRVADAIAGRAELYVDGGVRRGADVVKALAAGARAVLIGRPVLWGLAVDGEAGVLRVLELLRAELDLAMALCGCPTVASITPDLLG
jgi:4-hydroxymandelate oxidase